MHAVMGYIDLSRVPSESSESKATCTHDLCTMVGFHVCD